MNDSTIQSTLQEALEETIPSSQVDLWPAVRASLVKESRTRVQLGDRITARRQYGVPRLAILCAMLLTLVAVALLTPQGRVFSQGILRFFRQAVDTTYPLQPSQIAQDTPDAPAPTVEPPAPLISVAEAEAHVGFRVAELASVPDGLDYLGARLYGDAVSIEYQTKDYRGHLIIVQSQTGFLESDWDRVPAGAIVPVKIGELDGEFTQGTFVAHAGETVATWNPDAPLLRLRWSENDVWFEMKKHGDAEAIEYLDQAGMIELAENMAAKP